MSEGRVFLSAAWRDLVMLNYAVDPTLLHRHVPAGTELDSFGGNTYVSMVGFRFLNTKLLGTLPIPFHVDFLEVNLRFYVRRKAGAEERRGVVFISEIVPRSAIAATARLVYGENYISLPMKHDVKMGGFNVTAEYQWKLGGQWCSLSAEATGRSELPVSGSLEQFITEHYWGYSKQSAGGCVEYRVTHEPWQVWTASSAALAGDCSALYGAELASAVTKQPDSAFIAKGSPVIVHKGTKLR